MAERIRCSSLFTYEFIKGSNCVVRSMVVCSRIKAPVDRTHDAYLTWPQFTKFFAEKDISSRYRKQECGLMKLSHRD